MGDVIGVVGLGTMGLGIAQVFAQAGHRVLATDAHAPARMNAPERLAAALAPRLAAGKLTEAAAQAIVQNLRVTDSLSGLAGADLVIEAVAEDIALKHRIFAELEPILPPQAVLASNTSSLCVSRIAQGLARPARVVGLHFFNPAPAMKLVELIAPEGADPAALERARALTTAAGKTVINAPDTPGFIVNRCARPFYGEALALFEAGRSPSEIDAAMVTAGYRLGPFSLIDLIGADINLAASQSLSRAMAQHPRYHVFDALKDQVARGQLGRKTGRGFLFPGTPGQAPPDAEAIVLRIEAVLANEAASLLDAGAGDPAAIDTALRLGLNFPRGPFESARGHGLGPVRALLASLDTTAPPHLRGRYAISPALARMA